MQNGLLSTTVPVAQVSVAALAARSHRAAEVIRGMYSIHITPQSLHRMRQVHDAYKRKFFKEIEGLQKFAMKKLTKLKIKYKKISVMARKHVINDVAVVRFQKYLSNALAIQFSKLVSIGKYALRGVFSAAQERFDTWMNLITQAAPHVFQDKMQMVRLFHYDTITDISQALEAFWRWFMYYIGGVQRNIKRFCWESSSAQQYLERFRDCYRQSKKLCIKATKALRAEVELVHSQLADRILL